MAACFIDLCICQALICPSDDNDKQNGCPCSSSNECASSFCHDGYCRNLPPLSNRSFPWWVVFVIIFGGLLVLVGIVVCVYRIR